MPGSRSQVETVRAPSSERSPLRSRTRLQERPTRGEIVAVLLLTALALFLRVRGIDFLLPIMPLSDSTSIGRQVDALRGKSWEAGFEADRQPYPMLLARMTALLPEPPDVPREPAPALADHLRLGSEPWRQIRLVSAVLSVLIVPGTWWLARCFVSRGAALFAAALVATSLLHVNFAAHEKPHGPMSAFVVLAVVAGIWLRRKGSVPAYLFTGLTVGLSVAILHSGALALAILPVAFLLRERGPKRASGWWVVASCAIVFVSFEVSYPALLESALLRLRGSHEDVVGKALVIRNEVSLDRFNGEGFPVILGGLWSNDPVLLAAVLLGVLTVPFTRASRPDPGLRKDGLVVLAFALPYFAMVGLLAITQERYLPPLLPFFACSGAFGVERAVRRLAARFGGGSRRARALASAPYVLLPALALLPAWRLAEVRAAPETFAHAARFFERNAQPAEDPILIVGALDLPLLHGDAALAVNSQRPARSSWLRYQMRVPAELRLGPRYGILIAPGAAPEVAAALEADPIQYFAQHRSRFVLLPIVTASGRVQRALQEQAELVFRITPEATDAGESTTFTYTGTRNPDPWLQPFWLSVISMQRLGYTLEIYRLP